jgi:hypothetical protein
MGHAMGIACFMDKDQFGKMKKELTCAQARDHKTKHELDSVGEQVCGLLKGLQDSSSLQKTKLYLKLREWMPFMCDGFVRHVIW